ncbi:uncharacterized protein LOC109415244 isoform X2 [Aedes albopictus]|uniref:Uncharacterized protein n=1 Tax=Aedes albopictus TaxID=7160 RepID=A0ABM1ZK28_AEDAL|nr:uncharacterized protein LOC109415244 [Aedes albopictus]
MLYIESLTVSGIPGFDDHSLRFRSGLNLLRHDRLQQQQRSPSSYAIRFLVWFLNHAEPVDLQLEMAFGKSSYLEIRIRSDQPQYAFGVMSGKKNREQNLISLRRVLSRPLSVVVDGGKVQLPVEEFQSEMQQLGLRFGTGRFPMLNVIRGEDLERWIKSARKLWEIIHDVFQVEVFRRMQTSDQNRKGFCRQKMNNALAADYQDRIDELQGRINGSKMFRKLLMTLEMNAAVVAQKEVEAYEGTCKRYEGKLAEAVSQAEVLDEKRKELEDRLDEQDSVVPDVRELLEADLEGEREEEECCLAGLQSEEQSLEVASELCHDIESLVRKMQGSVDSMLGRMDKWLQAQRKIAQLEVELEINENCLHAAVLSPKIRASSINEFRVSLEKYLANSETRSKEFSHAVEMLNLTVVAQRQHLAVGTMDRERAVRAERGKDSIEEWTEIARKFTEAKLLAVFLQTEVRQKTAHLLQHIPENLSLESVQGMAAIQYFLLKTDDQSPLKQNFLGFVWQHLKFKESSLAAKVAALAMPHLADLLHVAVFQEHDPMIDLINQLSSRHSYHVLPLNVFSAPKTTKKIPSRVRPLTSLLIDSPLKRVLTELMDKYYYTNAPYAQVAEAVDPEILLICAHDDDEMVIGDGLVAGGWTRNAERTLEKLSEAVSLQVEIVRLKSELRKQYEVIPKLEECMEQIWNDIQELRQDAFDRYRQLHQSFPKISEMPSVLKQLFHQKTILVQQDVRFNLLTKFSQHLKTNKLNSRDWYKQRAEDLQKSLDEARQKHDAHEYDRDLIQFKHDVRKLGELLVQAESLHAISLPLELHKTLMKSLTEHQEELKAPLQVLENERINVLNTFEISNQLDLVQRQMIEPERTMLSYNYLFLELAAFLQNLRCQYPAIKFQQSKPKTVSTNLQRVYEARQVLNHTQPAYSSEEIERFKVRVGLCRAELDLLTDHRKFVVANMTLPCMDKLMALKLRLITQMVAELPGYLGETGSLRLNFQYDQTKCSQEALGAVAFQMDYIVGLMVDFVDDDGTVIWCLNGNSAVLPHLMFFLSLLGVEGCKLLVLDNTFVNLSQEERQHAHKLLELVSRSMQIFAAVE